VTTIKSLSFPEPVLPNLLDSKENPI